ncbi:hypothetical protein KC352_g51 [Hortaea werneckii]|nr:hypothetical protein KC352_g51 [Hortaea werneckii]
MTSLRDRGLLPVNLLRSTTADTQPTESSYSVGNWESTDSIYDNAYNVRTPHSCNDGQVTGHVIPVAPKAGDSFFVTEYIVELQTMKLFIDSKDIARISAERCAAAPWIHINGFKESMWQYHQPRDQDYATEENEDPTQSSKARKNIRTTINVFSYLNVPDVHDKMVTVLNDIREELVRADRTWIADPDPNHTTTGIVEHWDIWLERHFSKMIDIGYNFVNRNVGELRDFWLASVVFIQDLTYLYHVTSRLAHRRFRPPRSFRVSGLLWLVIAPPPRATTPIDPTLQSRPPPAKRRFPVRSYGPGSAPDIKQRTTSRDALDNLARTSAASQTLEAQDHRQLLRTVQKWENCSMWEDGREVEPDPTWGFYLMVTDYSQNAKDRLDGAVKSLLHVQHRKLGADADPPDVYADELYRRLKFDVVEDKEALEGASDDRVRECFRAHVRGLELSDEDDDYPPPPRNYACLVLDGSKADMLVNLVHHDERLKAIRTFKTCRLKAIDIFWQRPEMTRSSKSSVYEPFAFQHPNRETSWGSGSSRDSFQQPIGHCSNSRAAMHPAHSRTAYPGSKQNRDNSDENLPVTSRW